LTTSRSSLPTAADDASAVPTHSESPESAAEDHHVEGLNHIRLSSLVAESGIFSRREAERLIRLKRVTVNGQVVSSPSTKIDTEKGRPLIEVDNVTLKAQYPPGLEFPRLWAVMKNDNEIVANEDPQKSRSLLLDRVRNVLLPRECEKYNGLKPVHRLDYNIDGLLLLTNSAQLARMLETPGKHANYAKHYRVRVHGLVTPSKLEGLRRGLKVQGKALMPMEVTLQRTSNTISWLAISTKDNQPKAVQRSLQAVFLDITRMRCIGYGPYKLDEIFPAAAEPVGVREIKLDPAVSAKYLRMLNARTVSTFVR
jgi:23S rRNA pseudouridine2605 synthase